MIQLKRVVHQIDHDDLIPCEGTGLENHKKQMRVFKKPLRSPYDGAYADPVTTDCSSDDEDDQRREKKSVRLKRVVDLDDAIPCEEGTTGDENPKKRTLKSPYKGVYHRKSGKWSSEIRDPINKARIWLGTFGSPEEAYRVYLAKKLEFEARPKMNVSKQRDEFSVLPTGGSRDTSNWAASEEEDDSVGGVKGLGLEQFSQTWGGLELNSSALELGSLIIDNNGFLLGEFSRLDDLWICDMK